MAKNAPTLDTPFRRGEKVLTTAALGDLPEGTQGKIKLINGFDAWIRYWVRFEDGRIIGQIDHNDLVRPAQRELWKERAESATQSAATTDQPEAAGETAGAAGGGVGDRIPAHILERSSAAKARLLGG